MRRESRGSELRRIGPAIGRWVGVALTLIAVVATIWLAATGRLELYIHPRYTVFTVIMAAIGGVLAIAAFLVVPGGAADDDHDHDHDDHGDHHLVHEEAVIEPSGRVRTGLLAGSRIVIVVAAAVALLVVPPAALTAATSQNRELANSSSTLSTSDSPQLVGGDSSAFTVRDWSALLRQGGSDAVTGKTVAVRGYLLDTGEDDVVVVARLAVTCCAVDAQPVGIPMYLPDWRTQYGVNAWVDVTGAFRDNPDVASAEPLALVPSDVSAIDEPAQPYLF